jgi:hypothetical protein
MKCEPSKPLGRVSPWTTVSWENCRDVISMADPFLMRAPVIEVAGPMTSSAFCGSIGDSFQLGSWRRRRWPDSVLPSLISMRFTRLRSSTSRALFFGETVQLLRLQAAHYRRRDGVEPCHDVLLLWARQTRVAGSDVGGVHHTVANMGEEDHSFHRAGTGKNQRFGRLRRSKRFPGFRADDESRSGYHCGFGRGVNHFP